MDEIFEVLTLIQTGKTKGFPMILIGREYWTPLMHFIRDTLLATSAIDLKDLELLQITDSPEEAVTQIKKIVVGNFRLKYHACKSWI